MNGVQIRRLAREMAREDAALEAFARKPCKPTDADVAAALKARVRRDKGPREVVWHRTIANAVPIYQRCFGLEFYRFTRQKLRRQDLELVARVMPQAFVEIWYRNAVGGMGYAKLAASTVADHLSSRYTLLRAQRPAAV
jgi:hypothetical protein